MTEQTETTENAFEDGLGFKKKSANAGGIFFHIFDNNICQKSKVELDGWEGPIKTQHPKTKADVLTWVIRYDSLAAYVVDCNRFKKEFSQEQGGGRTSGLTLTLAVGKQRGILQLKWGAKGPDPVLKRWLKVAPSVNFDMPLLISVWKNNDGKQAVSFRQGADPDPQKWTKVEEYWKRDIDPATGETVRGGTAKGADGTILPEPEHDEFDDSWDYTAQNKFLMKHFMENTEPKIKAIAEKHGIVPDDDFFTADDEEVPVVTTKPTNPIATSLSELATGGQKAQLAELSQQTGFDFVANCHKVLGCNYDEISKEAASYAIYKLGTMVQAKAPVANAATAGGEGAMPTHTGPSAPPEPAPVVQSDPSDWGAVTPAPAAKDDGVPWD